MSATATKKKVKLPTVPSQIIREQIAALQWARRQKGLEIDMDHWCEPNGTCKVCEAGAWYVKNHGIRAAREAFADGEEIFLDSAVGSEVANLMSVMDYFRTGEIGAAYGKLGFTMPRMIADRVVVTEYEEDPKRHIADMLRMANVLELLGD